MAYNVVTNSRIISEMKKCRYFKNNLGFVSTIDKNGNRILNEKDKFAFFYNSQYNTTIFAQGNIGDIKFYIDYYIKEDLLAFYYNTEEFIFNFDLNIIKEKGIEFYLGSIIKKLETDFEDRIKEAETKKIDTEKKANPDAVLKNPGAVNYDDIQEYLKQKNKSRF
jgi:hypothetical protein